MAKIYSIQQGQPSRKTKRPPSLIWKEMLLLSCLLNVLQLLSYFLKK